MAVCPFCIRETNACCACQDRIKISPHKKHFSLKGMSHSALAEQWEAVGEIRDKARKLELATCMYIFAKCMWYVTYTCVLIPVPLKSFTLLFWGGSAGWWGWPGCCAEQHSRLESCCELSRASGWCPYMYGSCASFVRLHAHSLPQMLCLLQKCKFTYNAK